MCLHVPASRASCHPHLEIHVIGISRTRIGQPPRTRIATWHAPTRNRRPRRRPAQARTHGRPAVARAKRLRGDDAGRRARAEEAQQRLVGFVRLGSSAAGNARIGQCWLPDSAAADVRSELVDRTSREDAKITGTLFGLGVRGSEHVRCRQPSPTNAWLADPLSSSARLGLLRCCF